MMDNVMNKTLESSSAISLNSTINDVNNNSSRSNMIYQNISIISSTYTYYQSCSIPLYVIVAILLLILIIGVFGNVAVILVLILKRRMKSYANWLLLNLAVSDLLALMICIPLDIPLYINKHWIYSGNFCNVYYPFGTAAMLSSVYTVVILNLSRYCRIARPFGSSEMSTASSWCVIFGIWLCSVIMVLPLIVVLRYNSEEQFCQEAWQRKSRLIYSITLFILGFAGPIIISLMGYSSILWEIIITTNRRKKSDSASYRDVNMESENRTLVRLSFAVTLTFIMCELPNQIVCFLVELQHFDHVAHSIEIRTFSHIMLFLNSAVNPIVYNICSANFRRGGRELSAQFSHWLGVPRLLSTLSWEKAKLREEEEKENISMQHVKSAETKYKEKVWIKHMVAAARSV